MAEHEVRVRLDVKTPMRDGVLLSGDLYAPVGDGPFPVLLCRTIYDNQQQRYVDWAYRFAQNGYAAFIQDCRGRYDSDGQWEPYVTEADDGYDTQQWLGQQPWCDGTIGMFGVSYVGFTQVQTAPLRSPYLKALVPIANQEDNFGHIYADGVLQLQNAINFGWIGSRTVQAYYGLSFGVDLRPGTGASGAPYYRSVDPQTIYRRLPLVSALDDVADRPAYRRFVQHWRYDDYWTSYSLKTRYADVEAPALFITGWYDNLVNEVFKCFAGWTTRSRSPEARARTKLLVGPWTHGRIGRPEPFGDVEFGPASAVDIPGVQLRWFDRRLRGIENGIDDEPPVRIFVMGANVWRDEWEWPLARAAPTPYYLGGRGADATGGALGTETPADEPPDEFSYDPEDPVPTLGGQGLLARSTGPMDRREIARRPDVLLYATPPLARDLEVTGPVELVLHAASSAVDTDFTATLLDIHPDGKAIIICAGIARARFRDSLAEPTPIEPGRVYTYRIALWETSNLFRAGHRVGLEVSSSNFPRFDRNLNTGEDPATGTRIVVARQTIFHDAARPSHLLLPVVAT